MALFYTLFPYNLLQNEAKEIYLAPYCTRRALKRKAVSASFEKVFDLLIKEANQWLLSIDNMRKTKFQHQLVTLEKIV